MAQQKRDNQHTVAQEAQFFNSVYALMDAEHAKQGYLVPEHLVSPFICPSQAPLTDREHVGKILAPLHGKRLLDYGAGDGWNAVAFAKAGALVWAIDISPEAISLCKKKANANSVEQSVTCEVRDAYNTMFPDSFFDVVYGGGILHHLHVDSAAREISRILKPSGIAIFREPIRQTALMDMIKELVLWMTKRPRQKVTETEAPLDARDIRIVTKYFDRVELSFWDALSSVNPLIKSDVVKRTFLKLDSFAIRHLPLFSILARTVLIELAEPRK